MSIDPATAKRLRDVRRAGRELVSYCKGRTREELLTDRSLQLIVERLLEIIGEALRRAELGNPEVSELFPEIREIVGTRNRLIHGYDDINYQLVWDMVQLHVPALVASVDRILDDGNDTRG